VPEARRRFQIYLLGSKGPLSGKVSSLLDSGALQSAPVSLIDALGPALSTLSDSVHAIIILVLPEMRDDIVQTISLLKHLPSPVSVIPLSWRSEREALYSFLSAGADDCALIEQLEDGDLVHAIRRIQLRSQSQWYSPSGVRPPHVPAHMPSRDDELRMQRIHLALESVRNGVVITDATAEDQPIIYCNRAFACLTGYSEGEVLGKNCRFLQAGDSQQPALDEVRLALREKRSCEVLLRNYRKDGRMFWNEFSLSPVFGQYGQLQYFVGVQEDVTEKIQNQALQRERLALCENLKALDQILGIVGHELRTPLSGLRAMSEILIKCDAAGNPVPIGMVKSMHQEVVRMADMVNDLLEVARLNSGTAKWNWGKVRVDAALEDAVAPLRYLLNQDVELVVNRCDCSHVLGDQAAITRLVRNLVSNAIKYTPTGTIELEYEFQLDSRGRWLKILVSDTGVGIPADIAKRLGDAFALNSGVVGDQFVKGSGLGLTICRGISAAHGGEISVMSAPGKGTAVIVRLRADLPGPKALDGPLPAIHSYQSLGQTAAENGPVRFGS
jgi:PAS domain S-box-containing protein